jgi:hypothetical protein
MFDVMVIAVLCVFPLENSSWAYSNEEDGAEC